MPPRKRTTRINTRPKPKAPAGDEGKLLTEQERRRKLDVFLKDYDAKVKASLKMMEFRIDQLTKSVTGRLRSEIMQLPQQVREMTINDFVAAGGTMECAVEFLGVDETSTIGRSCPLSSTIVRTISQKRPKILRETILEEANANPTPAQNRKRLAAQTATKKNRLLQESSVYRPSNVLNSSMKTRYRTPSQRTMAMAGWDTPLITPKFDPKLPYTPAGVRDPKPGERLMSITGSPVSNPADHSVKLTDKGLSLHINNIDDMENMDIDIPEDHMRKVLDMFKNIMKKAKQ